MLIAQWDSLLRRHNVDLYLSGHDRDLQHLEFKDHPALGFTDLQVSNEEVVVRLIGKDATVLYEFKKPVDIMERSSSRSRTGYFFSATRMHTPDQRSCPNPGGGVALRGITPTFFVVNGYRASR
jgi:hypothetical protein